MASCSGDRLEDEKKIPKNFFFRVFFSTDEVAVITATSHFIINLSTVGQINDLHKFKGGHANFNV